MKTTRVGGGHPFYRVISDPLEGVAERADLPFPRRLPGQGGREKLHRRRHTRLEELVLVERGDEPFKDVAGRLHLAVDVVRPFGWILEPLGAERAVGGSQFRERELLVIADKLVGPQVDAVELPRGPQPPLAAVGQPEQAVRSAGETGTGARR
jgi:hypothetical protein